MCKKTSEYFKRSFYAVDGLWFMMLEDEFSFEKALDIDEKVWKIMPKIQAKKLKELYDIDGDTLHDLIKALKIKFDIEGFRAEINKINDKHTHIVIHECPWFTLMKQSGRVSFAGQVGERICKIEYQGWADAFNNNIKFTLLSQLCKEETMCRLQFQYNQ